jgi:hypothetical protein
MSAAMPAGPEPARGASLAQRLLVGAASALLAWALLATVVIAWQPGRFTQLGLALVVVALPALLAKTAARRVLFAALALLAFAAVVYLPSYALSQVVEFEVRGTTREPDTTSYLVLTDYRAKSPDAPGETFRNDDAPLFWKVNSSDWEGVIQNLVGQRVRARVFGIRFADRSLYKNLIWVEKAETEAGAR